MGCGTPGAGEGGTGAGEGGTGPHRPPGARSRRAPRGPGGPRGPLDREDLRGLRGDIADPGLAAAGSARIEWAQREMPVARLLRLRFTAEQPFAGLKIAACLHVTAETAVFLRALRCGGARVSLAASNPLSTQDDVAAALAAREEITVFARAGVDRRTYYRHIGQALGAWAGQGGGADGPDLVIDDGGDLVNTLHTQQASLLPGVRGGCESTATGVIRLRRMAAEGALAFPVIAANDTPAKRLVDGTCGTGQSVIDAVLRSTNTLLAGKTVVVAGFGACGRGVADRARGLGAEVIVTEVDPVRALEAVLHGFRVLPMAEAAQAGQVFVTATGSAGVIGAAHMAQTARSSPTRGTSTSRSISRSSKAWRSRCAGASGPTWTPTRWPTGGGCCCSPRAGWSTSWRRRGTRPR
jgi:adenosylhomocysteinase